MCFFIQYTFIKKYINQIELIFPNIISGNIRKEVSHFKN